MSPINYDLLEKLEKVYQRHHDNINAEPPEITELIAYQINDDSSDDSPEGEFDDTKVSTVNHKYNHEKYEYESDDEVTARISAYIKELAECAAKVHIKNNYINGDHFLRKDELRKLALQKMKLSWLIKPHKLLIEEEMRKMLAANKPDPTPDFSKRNCITRLSLNEFGLYPNQYRGPLSINGYNKLIEEVNKIGAQYPENIHLVLASIPVLISDDVVKNFVIYLQCGKIPILTSFAKAYPSGVDPLYPDTSNPDVREKKFDEAPHVPHFTCKSSESQYPSIAISHGGNVTCKTAGGISFRTAIDICLDHNYGVGKSLVDQEIALTISNGDSVLPLYTSHIIVSNSTSPDKEHIINNSVIQADPDKPQMLRINPDKKTLKKEAHVETIDILEPAFGSHTSIKIYAPRTLEKHSDSAMNEINSHNLFVIRLLALKKYREQKPIESKNVHMEIIRHISSYLYDEMNNVCLTPEISRNFKTTISKYQAAVRLLVVDNNNNESKVSSLLKKFIADIHQHKKYGEKTHAKLLSFSNAIINLVKIEKNENMLSLPDKLISNHSIFSKRKAIKTHHSVAKNILARPIHKHPIKKHRKMR